MNFYGLIQYVYGERRMESSLSTRQGMKSNLILDFIASGPLWIDRRCCSTSVHFLSGETFSSCRWWFMKYAWNHDQSHCARGLVEAEKSWGYVAGHGQTARRVGKRWPKLRNGNDQWLVMNHNRPSTFETKSSSLHSSQCYKNYLYSLNIAKVYIQLT